MRSTESGTSGAELATFDRPRSKRPVQLGVVADPHVPVDETGHEKLFEPTTMLKRVVADATHREVDYLFSLGDLTKDGVPEEYEVLDDVLEALDVPFASVPGNHDVPKEFDSHDSPPVSRFADRYTPEGLPFAIDVADLTVIGVDSASARAVSASHDGYVPESQVAWLENVLDGATDALVLVHHNLPGAIDQYHKNRQVSGTEPGWPPILREPDHLVDVLSRHDGSLVFSGHLHIPGLARTDSLREVMVPSTCMYPQGYLVVAVDPAGTSVQYVPVATQPEATEGYHARREFRPMAAALADMAAVRLASAPLSHDDQRTVSPRKRVEY